MARRKLIAANWKMNKTIRESREFAETLKSGRESLSACDLLVCPQFMALPRVCGVLDGTEISVGAQDLFWEDSGAFTGEISAGMIENAGATYVLVGHSERRHVLGEGNDIVTLKLKAAIRSSLTPILCVGEQIEQREAGAHESCVREQLETALEQVSADEMGRVVIAYEPVWAIGTGKTATAADAVAMHTYIRGWVRDKFRGDIAGRLRIQYGGSVKPSNAAELMSEEEIDGALIGGAGLEVESFMAIAAAVSA